jgi:hypothetical protein
MLTPFPPVEFTFPMITPVLLPTDEILTSPWCTVYHPKQFISSKFEIMSRGDIRG